MFCKCTKKHPKSSNHKQTFSLCKDILYSKLWKNMESFDEQYGGRNVILMLNV